MTKKVHILGNGDMAQMMPEGVRDGSSREGKLVICNAPPFEVQNVYACVMVDFKMMMALKEGSVNLDHYFWVLGNRPRIWCDQQPGFFMKHSGHIREFYQTVPKYAGAQSAQAATNFNCGHMATHYAAVKHQPDEIHMYGFDSIFDHNMRSYTDVVLSSDRSGTNSHRLLDIWRPIWTGIFNEFKNTEFVLYHKHPNAKTTLPENCRVVTSP